MDENQYIVKGCGTCAGLKPPNTLTRRIFSAFGLLTGYFASVRKGVSEGLQLSEAEVDIKTPDGVCDATFIHPKEGRHPAVLIWTDIKGLRDSFREMGRRLAAEGYSVLVPNPFYRSSRAPAPKPDFNFFDPEDRAEVMKMMMPLIADGAMERDAKAFIEFMDSHSSVDSSKMAGTNGYCMGGPLTMRTAAALPDRIGAAGSFHGGGLVTDKPNSPHLLVEKMKARFHIAIAANDDQREPDSKTKLREAFDSAKLRAEIKVYDNANHGWCVTDSSVYNLKQAEVAWESLLSMFKDELV